MNKLACGTRGCWPILISTTETVVKQTQTPLNKVNNTTLTEQFSLLDTNIVLACALVVTLVLLIITTCRICCLTRKSPINNNSKSRAENLTPINEHCSVWYCNEQQPQRNSNLKMQNIETEK